MEIHLYTMLIYDRFVEPFESCDWLIMPAEAGRGSFDLSVTMPTSQCGCQKGCIVSKSLHWYLPFSGTKFVFVLLNFRICFVCVCCFVVLWNCFVCVLLTCQPNVKCLKAQYLYFRLLADTVTKLCTKRHENNTCCMHFDSV